MTAHRKLRKSNGLGGAGTGKAAYDCVQEATGHIQHQQMQTVSALYHCTGGISVQELNYEKIGMRIRQVRKAKGWSQEELATRCGISMAFLGHIERGTRSMSLETLVSLCRELGTDADALLWGVPDRMGTVVQDLWDGTKVGAGDSYTMYIRIMKSVAEIMSEA